MIHDKVFRFGPLIKCILLTNITLLICYLARLRSSSAADTETIARSSEMGHKPRGQRASVKVSSDSNNV